MAASCAAARYRLAQRVQQLQGPSPLSERIASGIKQGWLAALTPAEKHTMSLISNVPRALVEANADAVADWLTNIGKPQLRSTAQPGLQGLLRAMQGFRTGLGDAKSDFAGFFSKNELTPHGGGSGGAYADAGGVRYKTALARWMASRVQAWSGARNRPFYQAAYEYSLTARARAAALAEKAAGSPDGLAALTDKWHDSPTADMVIGAQAAAEKFTFNQPNKFELVVRTVEGRLRAADRPNLRSPRQAAESQAASEGLTGQAAQERAAKLMSLKSTEFNRQVKVPRARLAEESSVSRAAAPISNAAASLVDIAAGFPKIAQNLATATIDYTPLGLAKTIWETARAVSGAKLPTLIAGLGKNGALAGGTMSLGYYLASKGVMTGPQPINASAGGDAAYHVRIGDKWYNYGLLEPFAAGMASGAALYEDTKLHPDNYLAHVQAASTEGVKQAGNAISQTVGPLADFVSGKVTDVGRAAGSLLSSPVPTLVRQIAKGEAGSRQTAGKTIAEQAANTVKSAIPGLANTLPKQEDAFGKQLHEGSAGEAARDVLIAGGSTTDKTGDPVVAEFDRLHVPLAPASGKKSFAQGHIKLELTPDERNAMLQTAGGPYHQLLQQFIQSPMYQHATDAQKAKALKVVKDKITNSLDLPAFQAKYRQQGAAP